MSNLIEAELKMYSNVIDVVTQNAAITNGLPNFTTNLGIVKTGATQITSIMEQKKLNKSGYTELKNRLKAELIVLVIDTCRKMGVYALFTNNNVLASEVDFNTTILKNLSDTSISNTAKCILDLAQVNLNVLQAYGITQETQTKLTTAMNDFGAAVVKKNNNAAERKRLSDLLKATQEKVNTSLKNMDAAVEIIHLSQPVFYALYKKSRHVVVMGTSSLSVKGVVIDATTGEAVQSADIHFMLQTEDGTVAKAARLTKASTDGIKKKSAPKGGFQIKSLPTGVYMVRVSKIGYVESVITIVVNNDDLTSVEIALERK